MMMCSRRCALRSGRRQIRINNMPLYAHGTVRMELEEFEVWAPGGKVVVHNGTSVTYLDPPPMRFFRGQVNGDPESFAYFSVDGTTGAIYGLVATRDGKFAVNAARRHLIPRDPSARGDRAGDFDYFLTASDESDEVPMTGQTWECGVEKLPALVRANRRVLTEVDTSGHPILAEGISGTQSYAITVEVETDDELYAAASNSVSAVTALATNLTGAVSTIYNRDLHTNVVQQNVNVYSGGPGTDPWAASDIFHGLAEIGNYYHTNHLALKRSAVVMLSGKTTSAGVAWEGAIGEGDSAASINSISTYSGAYAWCGSIGDFQGAFTSTAPDPNATTNGTLYGMPSGGNNYWPLEEYAHELGHNMAGHHTHCVAITNSERNAAGFTDGSPNSSTSNFVDHCDGTAGNFGEVGCYSGSDYVAGSQGTFKGTIMSYCHNVFVGAVPQSRFTFGQAAEPSHHELDDYMLNASGPGANGGTSNIVTAVGTMTMSTIAGSSSVAANSTGNAASVSTTNAGTVTYSWTITGGTITSATNIAAITYTAGASGSVVLRATAYKNGTDGFTGFPNGGVGITDTKTVTISTLSPPTNVVATAATATPTVAISWTASAGATKYHVYRSADNSTYVQVNGETTTTTSFTDSGAVHALISNASYLYRVRAVDGSNVESADSNKDLATTIIFTDATLTQQSTTIKAVHITQLRTAMTAICTLASNPSPCSTAFTDPSLSTSINVRVLHLTELRAKLNASRSALGLTAQSYAEGSITTATTIKAAQINELRSGVQ